MVTVPDTPENRAFEARMRAHEVWAALDAIERAQRTILQLWRNHNDAVGDNATRRDCGAFHARLRDLGLHDIASATVAKATNTGLRP